MADCDSIWISQCGTDAFGNIASGAVEGVAGAASQGALAQVAQSTGDGVTTALTALGTMWVKFPTLAITATDGTNPSDGVQFVWSALAWLNGLLLLGAFIFAACRMLWERRGEASKSLLKALLYNQLGAAALVVLMGAAVMIVDSLSVKILEAATLDGSDVSQAIGGILVFTPLSGGSQVLLIVLGLVVIFVSCVQIALMALRSGMLPLLVGMWPTAAIASVSRSGEQWMSRLLNWITAFTLYKLAAAIIYGLAIRMMAADMYTDDTGLISVITGTMLMIAALVALPALMRLMAPMTSAVAAGAGGGGGVAAGVLASGAISAGSKFSSHSGPSGASTSSSSTSSTSHTDNKSPAPSGASSSTGTKAPTKGNEASGAASAAGKTGASTGAAGAAGTGAGAAGTGAAGAGAGAAAAAGPVGAAAAAAAGAAQKVHGAAQSAVEGQTNEGEASGPSGAKGA
ncbi:hypothetical protein AAG589_21120 [Isoptericola sp. F-RaC21]|uniref:hypothetical protein n=1 Tax=Isoptericola sp. F-RaC21 TaxID=3141452 RepID=UPI00315B4FAC